MRVMKMIMMMVVVMFLFFIYYFFSVHCFPKIGIKTKQQKKDKCIDFNMRWKSKVVKRERENVTDMRGKM